MKRKILTAAAAIFLIVPGAASAQHIVKPGDTLWKIAQQHGMFFSRLKEINPNITNPDRIRVGQKINITDGTKADQVVEFAQALIPRTTYVYGGNLFDGAIKTDCSGWTKYIYEKFGIVLPRVSWEQARTGTPVTFQQLKKGDLMFFGDNGKVSHVGIYMGNQQWISNLGTGQNVKIFSIYGSWTQQRFLYGTRVL